LYIINGALAQYIIDYTCTIFLTLKRKFHKFIRIYKMLYKWIRYRLVINIDYTF